MGALDTLHAHCGRGDIELDDAEDQGDPRADGRDRRAHTQHRSPKSTRTISSSLSSRSPIVASATSLNAASPNARPRRPISRSWCAWEYSKRKKSGATRSSCTASISMCCSATSTPSSPIARHQRGCCAEAAREGKAHEHRPRPPRLRPAPASPPPRGGQARPGLRASRRRHQDLRRRATSCPSSTPAIACSARTACRRPRPSGRRCAQRYPGIELHLIGPLQSNKAKEAVAAVRRHPHHRPAEDRRRPSPARWRGRAGACSSSSRSTPARSRRRPASCRERRAALAAPVPRGAEARDRRPHVHPAARRGAGRALRLPRQARRRAGPRTSSAWA